MLVIWQSLDLHLPDHCMFWAACSLGYFGFLRASEFTVPNLPSFSSSLHLGVQDISVDSPSAPSCMRVRIKGSKTDPFRKGCFIHIGDGRCPLCAVRAVMNYLALRGDAPGPLFLLQNGQPLSHNILTDWLRQIMASARVPGNFSSHSFHIGATTVAARNGVPDHLIQSMGRWSSNAYQLHLRRPAEALAALSIKLAWCNACLTYLHPACASGSRARRLIHLGRAVSFTLALGRHPLCAVRAVMNYLALRGDAPGSLFFFVAIWTASLAQHLDGLASTDYGLSSRARKLLQP